ncbi:4'-phosphopantetheinyl transferase family protein [Streptomyces vietnamensis]|uniref:4'-phosphopantetheinyl transferase family protein n=1 Tax=Streptomyces vietnamensis TaxID=362257 RepID=UPI003438C147
MSMPAVSTSPRSGAGQPVSHAVPGDGGHPASLAVPGDGGHAAGRQTFLAVPVDGLRAAGRQASSLAVPADGPHTWILRVPAVDEPAPASLPPELDEAEADRAGSFVQPLDRQRYVAAHLALRRLLARYTGIPPGRIRLGRSGGPRGKPLLLDAPVPLHFSLSHSHGLIAIAVAGRPVGVDVQALPSPERVEACLPALHPAEREELAGLPTAERLVEFGRLWTRKEAFLKGLGTGLARPPAADYLGRRATPEGPEGWIVRDLPTHPGYAAATALWTPGSRT